MTSPRSAPAFAILSVSITCLAAAPAPAHEFWLGANRWTAGPGQPVEIGAYVGIGFQGERKRYRPERSVRFLAHAARRLDLKPLAVEGDVTWARFSPADRGGVMLSYESGFASLELPAEEFDAYLALEGLDGPLAGRRARGDRLPGRERYRRCAKAWLDGGDSPGRADVAAARASQPTGVPLEIVPLARPGARRSLRLRVLFQGRPLAGVLVRAWRSPWDAAGVDLDPSARDSTVAPWQERTDARGETEVPALEPGKWLVSAVHMVPCREPRVADWESTWTSLTFACAAKKPITAEPQADPIGD